MEKLGGGGVAIKSNAMQQPWANESKGHANLAKQKELQLWFHYSFIGVSLDRESVDLEGR